MSDSLEDELLRSPLKRESSVSSCGSSLFEDDCNSEVKEKRVLKRKISATVGRERTAEKECKLSVFSRLLLIDLIIENLALLSSTLREFLESSEVLEIHNLPKMKKFGSILNYMFRNQNNINGLADPTGLIHTILKLRNTGVNIYICVFPRNLSSRLRELFLHKDCYISTMELYGPTRTEPSLCVVDKLSPDLWLVLKLVLKSNFWNCIDILKSCPTSKLEDRLDAPLGNNLIMDLVTDKLLRLKNRFSGGRALSKLLNEREYALSPTFREKFVAANVPNIVLKMLFKK